MQLPRPKMFSEAEKSRSSSNIFQQIGLFILVFIIIAFAEGIIPSLFTMPSMVSELAESGRDSITFQESYDSAAKAMQDPKIMLISLFCTVFGTVISIFYCRTCELRSYGSMGVRKRKAARHYSGGLIVGLAMMSAIAGISALTGTVSISAVSGVNMGIIVIYFFAWIVQGMSEEFIFRGYLMNSVGGKHSVIMALAVSSIAFACAHLSNPGITVLAFVNLVLFGTFAGLYMICFDDIWGVCAIHSVWNFAQGNLFGISVSGTGETDSILRTAAISKKTWLSGGEFGIEGSIFTTIILTAASAAVIACIIRNSRRAEKSDK